MKITFLGAGVFGKELGRIVTENGHEVKFYDPYKIKDVTLESAITAETEAIIYVAPASAADELLPKLPTNIPLICASKGFLSLTPFTKFKDFSALGGAAFADDLKNETPHFGDQIVLTASSHLSEFLFSTEAIKIEYTADTFGIVLCGALKNLYAIGAGLAYTKDPEFLEKYLKKVFVEFEDILFENGANPDTTRLSCGLPDLLISSTADSRNFNFGVAIGKKQPLESHQTIEGLTAFEHINEIVIPSTASTLKSIIRSIENATK